MLFKVQIDAAGKSVLIYNEDNSVMLETADEYFIAAMDPQILPAKYFMHGEATEEKVSLNIDAPLPPDQWPDW